MVQDGRKFVVPFITYFSSDLVTALVFIRDNEKAFLVEVGLIYFLYGIVRNSFFAADYKLVFIGDKLVVFDYEIIYAEKYRGTDKERRRLLVENHRRVGLAVIVDDMLFVEAVTTRPFIFTQIAVVAKNNRHEDANADIDYKVSPSVFTYRCLDSHLKVLR